MNSQKYLFLRKKAYALRCDVIKATTAAGSGHLSSCLSAADIIAVLFFEVMQYDSTNLTGIGNDRCLFSKGHAAPLLYAAWKEVGVIDEKELLTLRKFKSVLEGHPTTRFAPVEVATGSLGCGLSMGLGMVLALRMDGIHTNRVYVLLGDSECSEGSLWEAVQLAAYYKTEQLVAIIDVNGLGQRGKTLYGDDSYAFAQRLKAFGWHTIEVDGHSIEELVQAFTSIKEHKSGPVALIARTVKGKGISFIENKNGFHGVAFAKDKEAELLHELFMSYKNDVQKECSYQWAPILPVAVPLKKGNKTTKNKIPSYDISIATRKVYGDALIAVHDDSMVVLDAEVSNSTCAQTFAQEYPHQFVECFVAEQNMVCMAVGMAALKKTPFISTFGAFLTRAFDQIRMAAIGRSALRIVGSHCGVSIGQDGPSQMALEDIAMMRAVPHSIIMYPCDAISTMKLVFAMKNYQKGISYLRLTREATKIIYSEREQFEIGGCKVLIKKENAKALIVVAGITVHEALKAVRILEDKNVTVNVIDAYSVKPLDVATIIAVAQKSSNMIITVEDHYSEGGLGQAVVAAVCNESLQVHMLAVTEIPCSGTPEELRSWAGIDALSIVAKVLALKN